MTSHDASGHNRHHRGIDTVLIATRLGRVDDPESLAQALGSGDVRIEFSRH